MGNGSGRYRCAMNKHFKIFLCLLAACTLQAYAEEDEADTMIPINRTTTTEAWTAFKAGDYQKAIVSARECISRYQPSADGIQRSLEEKKAVLPVGDVSAGEKERIEQYQILHDVARCLLIAAWSEEKLGRKADAAEYYREVQPYTFARIFDENVNACWSAADRASRELKYINSK